MKFVIAFLLMVAVSANAQETVVPYMVPIYRVTINPTSSTTEGSTGSTATGSTATGSTATTTTATVPTSATTSQKPTIPAVLENVANLIEVKQIRHPRSLVLNSPKGLAGYSFEHVCSGTLIDAGAVITTVTCIELATTDTDVPAYVGTAADPTSIDSDEKVLYQVDKANNHPEYDSTTFENNVAVLKLMKQVDFTLSAKVEAIPWALETPAVEARCVASFWNAEDPFKQVVSDVNVKACDPLKNGTICSSVSEVLSVCPNGANGASLVCSSKLAGVFTAQRNSDCSAALWQYEDITEDATWIESCISAAPIFNISFAAILVLISAMLKHL